MRVCTTARAAAKTTAVVPAVLALALVPAMLLPVGSPRVGAAGPQSPKRLWVLQEPDAITEYDVITFAARQTVKVPRRLVEHPEYLSINARGQMVFLPPAGTHWAGGDVALSGDRVWFWDGRQAREWNVEEFATRGVSGGEPAVTDTARQWFLSAGGESLFWFENRFEDRAEKGAPDSGPQRSVRSTARVWRTDLSGGWPEDVATLSASGWCRCETGACEETCPAWEVWVPDGIVSDFFLATRVTQGQLQATYHETLLYRPSGPAWRARRLPQAVERFLAASARGDMLVATVPDGGCCGWDNEGNDQLLILRNGKVSVLYDEAERYRNRNYDVSFYPSDARFAPGGSILAYTIVSTAGAGTQIRLSSEGKDDAEERARVRTAIAGLPAVEVVQLDGPSRPAAVIPRAGLVGWLTDRKLLVARDGLLTVCDSRGNASTATPIRVRTAADAFLR